MRNLLDAQARMKIMKLTICFTIIINIKRLKIVSQMKIIDPGFCIRQYKEKEIQSLIYYNLK